MSAIVPIVPAENEQIDQAADRRSPTTGPFWDCAVWAAGLIYLFMALALNIYNPLFGLALIAGAGYRVIEPRCFRRGA